MKKTDLARLQQQAQELESVNDSYLQSMITVFENAFSAIATAEPKIALSIIAQMGERKEEINSLIAERKSNADRYVEALASRMPDYLELEDGEEESDETDNEDMN